MKKRKTLEKQYTRRRCVCECLTNTPPFILIILINSKFKSLFERRMNRKWFLSHDRKTVRKDVDWQFSCSYGYKMLSCFMFLVLLLVQMFYSFIWKKGLWRVTLFTYILWNFNTTLSLEIRLSHYKCVFPRLNPFIIH